MGIASWISRGAALAVALVGCATAKPRDAAAPAPVAPGPTAEQESGARGDAIYARSRAIYADPTLHGYLTAVLDRLVAHVGASGLRFEVKVLDSYETEAMTLPAGYIYLSLRSLAVLGSEAELAGVLGHEIGHSVARHGISSDDAAMTRDTTLSPFLTREIDTDTQFQADRLGVGYMRAAGYDPREDGRGLSALERYDEEVEEAWDPAMRARMARLARYTQDAAGGEIGRDAYLDHVDGLPFAEGATLRVRRARQGGRFDRVASRVCAAPPPVALGDTPIQTLAAINELDSAEAEVPAGAWIKCVEP